MTTLAKKTSKNQLTLPKAVVDRFPGVDYFEVSADADRILLKPVRFGGEMVQRIGWTRIRMLGMLGQLRDGSKHQVVDAATDYLLDVPITIAGGTSEINRNIIATRGLGLPRG